MLIPESAGPEMKAVLKGMLQFDVTKRSSAKETRNLMTGKQKRFSVSCFDTLHSAYVGCMCGSVPSFVGEMRFYRIY